MHVVIKEFYNGTKRLSEVIDILGCRNVVFELQSDKDAKPKLFIMCDKSSTEHYDKAYKIYLLSTDLTRTESFYMLDLEGLLKDDRYTVKAKVHYRGDLVSSRKRNKLSNVFRK